MDSDLKSDNPSSLAHSTAHSNTHVAGVITGAPHCQSNGSGVGNCRHIITTDITSPAGHVIGVDGGGSGETNSNADGTTTAGDAEVTHQRRLYRPPHIRNGVEQQPHTASTSSSAAHAVINAKTAVSASELSAEQQRSSRSHSESGSPIGTTSAGVQRDDVTVLGGAEPPSSHLNVSSAAAGGSIARQPPGAPKDSGAESLDLTTTAAPTSSAAASTPPVIAAPEAETAAEEMGLKREVVVKECEKRKSKAAKNKGCGVAPTEARAPATTPGRSSSRAAVAPGGGKQMATNGKSPNASPSTAGSPHPLGPCYGGQHHQPYIHHGIGYDQLAGGVSVHQHQHSPHQHVYNNGHDNGGSLYPSFMQPHMMNGAGSIPGGGHHWRGDAGHAGLQHGPHPPPPPPLYDFLSTLTAYVDTVLPPSKRDLEQRERLFCSVQAIARGCLGLQVEVRVHGSVTTGLALSSSDVDFLVVGYPPLLPLEALQRLSTALVRADETTRAEAECRQELEDEEEAAAAALLCSSEQRCGVANSGDTAVKGSSPDGTRSVARGRSKVAVSDDDALNDRARSRGQVSLSPLQEGHDDQDDDEDGNTLDSGSATAAAISARRMRRAFSRLQDICDFEDDPAEQSFAAAGSLIGDSVSVTHNNSSDVVAVNAAAAHPGAGFGSAVNPDERHHRGHHDTDGEEYRCKDELFSAEEVYRSQIEKDYTFTTTCTAHTTPLLSPALAMVFGGGGDGGSHSGREPSSSRSRSSLGSVEPEGEQSECTRGAADIITGATASVDVTTEDSSPVNSAAVDSNALAAATGASKVGCGEDEDVQPEAGGVVAAEETIATSEAECSCSTAVYGPSNTNGYLGASITTEPPPPQPSSRASHLHFVPVMEGPLYTVQTIITTRVPVIKIVEKATGLKADITFAGGEHWRSMQLTHSLITTFPQARKLILFLKHCVRCLGIGDSQPGGVTSFAIYLMVRHFFNECTRKVVEMVSRKEEEMHMAAAMMNEQQSQMPVHGLTATYSEAADGEVLSGEEKQTPSLSQQAQPQEGPTGYYQGHLGGVSSSSLASMGVTKNTSSVPASPLQQQPMMMGVLSQIVSSYLQRAEQQQQSRNEQQQRQLRTSAGAGAHHSHNLKPIEESILAFLGSFPESSATAEEMASGSLTTAMKFVEPTMYELHSMATPEADAVTRSSRQISRASPSERTEEPPPAADAQKHSDASEEVHSSRDSQRSGSGEDDAVDTFTGYSSSEPQSGTNEQRHERRRSHGLPLSGTSSPAVTCGEGENRSEAGDGVDKTAPPSPSSSGSQAQAEAERRRRHHAELKTWALDFLTHRVSVAQLFCDLCHYYGCAFNYETQGIAFGPDGSSAVIIKPYTCVRRGQYFHMTSPFDPEYDLTARMTCMREFQWMCWWFAAYATVAPPGMAGGGGCTLQYVANWLSPTTAERDIKAVHKHMCACHPQVSMMMAHQQEQFVAQDAYYYAGNAAMMASGGGGGGGPTGMYFYSDPSQQLQPQQQQPTLYNREVEPEDMSGAAASLPLAATDGTEALPACAQDACDSAVATRTSSLPPRASSASCQSPGSTRDGTTGEKEKTRETLELSTHSPAPRQSQGCPLQRRYSASDVLFLLTSSTSSQLPTPQYKDSGAGTHEVQGQAAAAVMLTAQEVSPPVSGGTRAGAGAEVMFEVANGPAQVDDAAPATTDAAVGSQKLSPPSRDVLPLEGGGGHSARNSNDTITGTGGGGHYNSGGAQYSYSDLPMRPLHHHQHQMLMAQPQQSMMPHGGGGFSPMVAPDYGGGGGGYYCDTYGQPVGGFPASQMMMTPAHPLQYLSQPFMSNGGGDARQAYVMPTLDYELQQYMWRQHQQHQHRQQQHQQLAAAPADMMFTPQHKQQ